MPGGWKSFGRAGGRYPARLAGASWDRVGQRMGISRQAAQQRFGRTPTHTGTATAAATRRLTPVTAFDGMAALAGAGRHGWHSIGFGMYFHDLDHSSEQWEHLRVGAFGAKYKDLQQAGRQRIGSMWFPGAPTSAPRVSRPIQHRPGSICSAEGSAYTPQKRPRSPTNDCTPGLNEELRGPASEAWLAARPGKSRLSYGYLLHVKGKALPMAER